MARSQFIDRATERRRLDQALTAALDGRPQLVVVWGRRRVGKTFLLHHFLRSLPKDVRTLYHGATEQAPEVELRRLADSVARDLGPDAAARTGGGFTSWEAALTYLAALATDAPLVVVMDEVPYLARAAEGFATVVQAIWDRITAEPLSRRFMLVLAGSAVGTMEHLLGSTGALHRRPTLELRMEPVSVREARQFLPSSLTAEGVIEAYAACGGYPLHLLAWQAGTSLSENLEHLAGTPGGLLLEDAPAMLREELMHVAGAYRVLAAVGRGRTHYNEIRNDAGQRIERQLETLASARFLRTERPVGAPKRAPPLHQISDPYLRFWFSVLYANAGLIEGGQGRAALAAADGEWRRHVAWVFEEAAREHAVRLIQAGRLPGDMLIGRWWSRTGQVEIDVLGLRGKQWGLIGEAKWSRHPVGLGDMSQLVEKGAHGPEPAGQSIYAFWCRAGARHEVRAGVDHVYGPEDLLS